VIDLKLGFSDALHRENISLDFPCNPPPFLFICNVVSLGLSLLTPYYVGSFLPAGDKFQDNYVKETRGPTDAVKLDPVSLFNYRLWCAATREKFGEAEIGDFGLLQRAFNHELHSHKSILMSTWQ
jgi:hypothetical protein